MGTIAQGLGNTYTQARQASVVGARPPPDMSEINKTLLAAASPNNFSLPKFTRTDQSGALAQAERCRKEFTGIGGLRRLQNVQADKTVYDGGCGWIHKQNGAHNPVINRAALGSVDGPIFGLQGQEDSLVDGARFYMDLDEAEQTIARETADALGNKCRNLQDLTADNKQYFGYCKATKKIIPIERNDTGTVIARYPEGNPFYCDDEDIVPASQAPNGCSTEGFLSGRGGAAATVKEGFAAKKTKKLSLMNDDFPECSIPYTKSCIMKFARSSGCTDDGALLDALKTNPNEDAPYDRNLSNNKAFAYYTSKLSLQPSLLREGSTSSRAFAFEEFNRLATTSAQSVTEKNAGITLAARDLCIQKGVFEKDYDQCAEITPSTRINESTIECAQKVWRQRGGANKGTAYPTLQNMQGKTFQELGDTITTLIENSKSRNTNVQGDAIKKFIGTETTGVTYIQGLPRGNLIQGSEVVWIYTYGFDTPLSIPIILGRQVFDNTNGEVIPDFIYDYNTGRNNVMQKYGLFKDEAFSFLAAFELRPDTDTNVTFSVWTDDGFAMGVNQNPREGLNDANDFDRYWYQPPTYHNSRPYLITADDKNQRNVCVFKWFQGPGAAVFRMWMNGQEVNKTPKMKNMFYLTQLPEAPWIQFEVCSRPNAKKPSTMGFFEKRWNGPSGFPWYYGTKWTLNDQQPYPSFDCEWAKVNVNVEPQNVVGVPGGKGYLSFTPNSWWRTQSCLAFNSVKTITMLVRPMATLAAGGMASVWWWPAWHNIFSSYGMETPGFWIFTHDGKEYQFDLWIGNRGHNYQPCKINDWNLVVIYVNCDENGVYNFNYSAQALSDLRTEQQIKDFSAKLQTKKQRGSQILIPPIRSEADHHLSGRFILGGGHVLGEWIARQSFTGDIAWLHCFDHYLENPAHLHAEITQTWSTRWPRGNLDDPRPPAIKAKSSENIDCSVTPVALYQHCTNSIWGRGAVQRLCLGEHGITQYNNNNPPFMPDASYIVVDPGYMATIYDGPPDAPGTRSYLVDGGANGAEYNFCDQGAWANDRIRTIRVERAINWLNRK